MWSILKNTTFSLFWVVSHHSPLNDRQSSLFPHPDRDPCRTKSPSLLWGSWANERKVKPEMKESIRQRNTPVLPAFRSPSSATPSLGESGLLGSFPEVHRDHD